MRHDDLYLQDIADACRSIHDFLDGMSKDDFLQSEIAQAAVVQRFIVIGEASSKIGEELREEQTGVDWRTLTTFRNFLVHVYFNTTLERVWEATQDVDQLAGHVDAIIRFRREHSE